MGYSDQKFYARNYDRVTEATVATGTATASGANTLTSQGRLPRFPRRTQVNTVRVEVITAPAANLTNVVLAFLNGTNTFATATVGTNTAGTSVTGTVNVAYNVLAADVKPTITVVGTATASGQNYGAYDVYFETQELFSS